MRLHYHLSNSLLTVFSEAKFNTFCRYKLLDEAETRYRTDGLNVSAWTILKVTSRKIFLIPINEDEFSRHF